MTDDSTAFVSLNISHIHTYFRNTIIKAINMALFELFISVFLIY